MEKYYEIKNQKETIERLTNVANTYVTKANYLARGHLAPNADFTATNYQVKSLPKAEPTGLEVVSFFFISFFFCSFVILLKQ